MASALVSGSRGPGSSPGRGHCVVFLCKTLYSHNASLHPGVQIGTGERNAGGNPGGTGGPLGSYVDLTFYHSSCIMTQSLIIISKGNVNIDNKT